MVAVVAMAGWFASHDQKVTRGEGIFLQVIFLVFTVLSY
jgi:hypothetical protein